MEQVTWPGWETLRVIGRGSFGTVYAIRRSVAGDVEHAALKYLSIPASEDEIVNLQSEGMDSASITRTFREQLNDILNEYKLMRKLNECPNVVRCDDVQYVQKQDGFGWDILIRMELLTPITKQLAGQSEIPEEQVIALGKDLSRALIRCEENHILHRDIKPQNIFVSEDGKYKLGDFGIAKAKEKTGTDTARAGTSDYMAPEVYYGEHYDKTADIYSLGIVLYWLLNNRKMPFLPQSSTAPRLQEREDARMRRLKGEALPPPVNGSKELKRIVLKCCAFKPKDRYADANALLADMRALERIPRKNKSLKRKRRYVPVIGAAITLFILLFGCIQFYKRIPYIRSPENSRREEMAHSNQGPEYTESEITIDADNLSAEQESVSQEDTYAENAEGLFAEGERLYLAGDYNAALKAFTEAANNDDTEAMLLLGVMYESGMGVSVDYAKALELFTKASDLGNGNAMHEIGLMHILGIYSDQNFEKAAEWFEKASDVGCADAMDTLGLMYQRGVGVIQNLSRAMELFERAASEGNESAMNHIGQLYQEGFGTAPDYATSLEWYKKAADNGSTDAMINIALLYYYGLGVTQNYSDAKKWFQKAADAENPSAMNYMGLLYDYGQGVEQDYTKSMEWFIKAANAGDADAFCYVGAIYENGKGVSQSYETAIEWYQKGIDAGSSKAMVNLGTLYYYGRGVNQDYSRALELYINGADAGNSEVLSTIGSMYYYGQGTNSDYVKAFDWYSKAANMGDAYAMYQLGILYEYGMGVAQSYDTAMLWYQNAAERGNTDAKARLGQ